MAGYALSNDMAGVQQNLAAAYKSILAFFATTGALTRGYVYEFNISVDGLPANNSLTWNVSRMTADGTGSGATPSPLNGAYSAMLGSGKINYTVEPTPGVNLWTMALNQQSSYRWVSGREALCYPATANNGLIIRSKSAVYTSTVLAHALAEE